MGGTPETRTHVFSRTLRQEDCPNMTISDNPGETVAALKEEPGKEIWLFGGGVLFSSLLQLGLVDVVEVAIIPVLLGDGLPLLPGSAAPAKLELTNHIIYEKSGTILLEYTVA